MSDLTTEERILKAAIKLISEHGFKGATTRKIADTAGVNEVTIFRHYGNKSGLIEAAISKYGYIDKIDSIFDENVAWDLRHDLKMFVIKHHEVLDQKRELILISLKEEGKFPELDAMLSKVPKMYEKKLIYYLEEMIKKKKLKPLDVKITAESFIYMNFGYFLMKTRLQEIGEKIDIHHFVEKHVELFIQTIE